MKNKAPIILNCFSRGGSNILWNIFLSHPDVCSPIFETLEIFRTNILVPKWEGYESSFLSLQPRLFDQWLLKERREVPSLAQKFIDSTLYKYKLLTLTDLDMKYKYEDEIYTMPEVQNSRLTIKNNNGLAFLTDMFNLMYPDSIFFSLVRDSVPLYESHKRRKITKNPQEFSTFYNKLIGRVKFDKNRFMNFHVIRFEDILSDPIHWIMKLYMIAGLDPSKVSKVRFKAKPHYFENGTYGTKHPAFGHYWFEKNKVYEILEPNINRYQVDRISEDEQQQIEELTRNSREFLDYV